jgi:hypothetical protein
VSRLSRLKSTTVVWCFFFYVNTIFVPLVYFKCLAYSKLFYCSNDGCRQPTVVKLGYAYTCLYNAKRRFSTCMQWRFYWSGSRQNGSKNRLKQFIDAFEQFARRRTLRRHNNTNIPFMTSVIPPLPPVTCRTFECGPIDAAWVALHRSHVYDGHSHEPYKISMRRTSGVQACTGCNIFLRPL